MCKALFSLPWQHNSNCILKKKKGRVNTFSHFDIIWSLVSNTGQHIIPQDGLWLCLCGTVFIILIEMGRIFDCLWHHHMVEIQDCVMEKEDWTAACTNSSLFSECDCYMTYFFEPLTALILSTQLTLSLNCGPD